jgi:hypothetical protein
MYNRVYDARQSLLFPSRALAPIASCLSVIEQLFILAETKQRLKLKFMPYAHKKSIFCVLYNLHVDNHLRSHHLIIFDTTTGG